jgi:hypothetical protein
VAELSSRLSDPALRRLAGGDSGDSGFPAKPELAASAGGELSGELGLAPRRPVLTVILALTLVLPLMHLGRLLLRYALAYKTPARLKLSDRGLELGYRVELLGRVLRERSLLVPLDNVATVTREVRFARLGMYAGLLALVLGSYLGMGMFVDAVRVDGGSATLLGMGTLLIVAGLLADFGLSSLSDSVKGTCRLVVVPRKGRALCVGSLEPQAVDTMLNGVAERAAG